jgi:FkbM family methyltransferase
MSLRNRVHEYLARRLGVPRIPFALERLARLGFKPEAIFDVGAYRGEFAKDCLRVWPRARISCFEALEHRVEDLKRLSASNPSVRVFPGLLGAREQERVALNESETASSVLEENAAQDFQVNFYPMRTVDGVIREHLEGRGPDLLKLDVQGYELEVLKGAEETLQHTLVVLAEVNFLDIHRNVPLLSDLVMWLGARDWVAYDVCGLTRRPLDNALWQADLIFVPRTSELRADKRWAA